MQFSTEQNKKIVIRFNKEYIEQGNRESFDELVAEDVINHSAPPGSSKGPDGMIHFLQNVLRTGFPDLSVEILEQVAERDLVTTRKTIHATHSGVFMGIPPTGKKVAIHVIDIIRLRRGKYAEHWGMSNLPDVTARLSLS
jgi:predicted ester cyclase